MDYDKIIIDLLNRIVTLEDRVTKLEKNNTVSQPIEGDSPSSSKKYRFLSDYLQNCNEQRVRKSFSEIENILKFQLPDSAFTHRAFWANTTTHSFALSWLSVNYIVSDVNLEEEYVVFEKKRDFEQIRTRKSTATTEEKHLLDCKNYDMVVLYEKLRETMFGYFNGVGTGATSYYIHWNITGRTQRQFANIYIQKNKIRIETMKPITNYNIGENVPDKHGYTLNYRTDIFSDEDIDKVKGIILESYEQIKRLI